MPRNDLIGAKRKDKKPARMTAKGDKQKKKVP